MFVLLVVLAAAACGSDHTTPLTTAPPGVVFAYPLDGQRDVPVGVRVIVTFSDPVVKDALGCSDAMSGSFCLVGPSGPVTTTPTVTGDGKTVVIDGASLDPGASYQLFVRSALAPTAQNLPASGPLVTFTTRSDRPRAAPPTLVAVNGGDPANPESFHPIFETSTIRLVFSEPLDPRTVLAPGAIELLDGSGAQVPVTIYARDIHVSIDPVSDLVGGATYQLRLTSQILDLGGQALAPVQLAWQPRVSVGATKNLESLRTREMGDPGTTSPRFGMTTNAIELDHPLIGSQTTQIVASTLAAELGDPQVLGGPIAFTVRRGQRLRATGLNVALGGQIPTGLSTGDIFIEFLTDGGGRIYRNPNHSPDQNPENDRSPVYADFTLDIAVYAVDPKGNAVLSQTVLGLQAAGIGTATQGVLDLEAAATVDLDLLGVAKAPMNVVLELITDTAATPPVDQTPPTVVATFPAASSNELPVDAGIEIVFSKPIDLVRARGGGLLLETAIGATVPSVIESHGAAVVLRPLQPFAYSTVYHVAFPNVTDVAGNPLGAQPPLTFQTPPLASTSVPLTVVSAHPGPPCALAGGRCVGGLAGDDAYAPFTLPANQDVRIDFSQPLRAASIVHGAMCNSGDVRIEQIDGTGACAAAVPGTLRVHDRALEFVPDQPWTVGTHYRVTLISGGNSSCDAGDVCGITDAASWDPLKGTTSSAGGGPPLVIDFTAAPATTDTLMFGGTTPFTDINGSGYLDGAEQPVLTNAAPLRITGHTGDIDQAQLAGSDCVPSTPELENCIYVQGVMPTQLTSLQQNCTLPDGTVAPVCMPVVLAPEAMYGTSVTINATIATVFNTNADTGTAILRLRQPAGGPLTAYIIDDGGTAAMVAKLDFYMDAPDLSLPLSTHDLHSKQLSATLKGPVQFLPDGRFSITAANVADVKLAVHIDALGGVLSGDIDLLVPAGLMKLQLASPPIRGALP
jgi:hypothetical protein